MSFNSKVVIVTGSSGGIGAAIALAFCKEKADVVITGRSEEKLQNMTIQCEALGKHPLVIKADLSIDTEAEGIISKTIDRFGKIDILINNAGVLKLGTLDSGTFLDAFDVVNSVNLRPVVYLTQLATPYLKASNGNVINISSVLSQQIHNFKYTAYGMLKAALDMFTKGAAMELGRYGVRVNTVNPGPIVTDIFRGIDMEGQEKMEFNTVLQRWGEAYEIADLVLFIASDKAKSITGSNYTSDNGFLLVQQ